jgi:hypothetical protein
MAGMIGYLDNFLVEVMRFIVLDVTERWFRFNFSIAAHVDNLDKGIGWLFC